ncbi:MAG TPA: hypothetical protein PKO07_12630 [Pseudomonadota bacterium]|nr:hypothetical protein [Pseudomonadota bacterium]
MTSAATTKSSANPFAHTAVSDLDHDDLVDVGSLHPEARQLLQRALKQAGRGFGQLIALVGDPGAGKSHLLWWLKRQHRPESLVVTIPALPDLAQPFRYTLKQLLSGLCRVDKKGAKLDRPIDRLLWEVIFSQTYDLLDAARVGMYQGPTAVLKQLGPLCLDGGKRRPIADFAEAAQKVWPEIEPGLRSYLLTLPTENSLDATARQVIVQFPYADRRALTTAWLAGEELSQKDREKIGAKQTINQEATARYVLCSLIRLATIRRPASFTILFDQADQVLEQLGQPGLHALAEVMGSLHGLTAATLLLLSCRPDTFGQFSEKQARPGPSQIKQSMELISLSRIAPAQLREVVAARLQSVTASGAAAGLHPLQDADLSVLHEVDTPRAALMRLAALYSERLASGGAQAKPAAVAKPTPAPATTSKPAQAKIDPSAAKTTDNTRPVVISKAAETAAKAAAEKSAKPSVKPTEKAAKTSEAVPKANAAVPVATKAAESQATPSKAWMAMSGEGDALADAMAQAEKGEVSIDKARSTTHVDKSGPAVPKEAKLAPTAKVVIKDAAPKQVQSAAPVSRADSGDTVRRVPDEALIAKTRDAAAKATAPAATPVAKTQAPAKATATPAPAKTPAPAPAPVPAKAQAPAKAAAKPTPAAAPSAEKAKPAASAKPDPAPTRAPSSDTPSRAWLDMAGDNDPLADAIAAAKAELGPSFAAEAAKPIKAKPVEPLPKTSKPLVPTDFEPTRQIVIPPGMSGFPDFAALSSEDKTEIGTAESAVSPSVSWLAMAADESVSGGDSDAGKSARAPRGTAAMGVVVPGSIKVSAPSGASAGSSPKAARATQARIAPVAVHKGSSLSPLRVLAVLEGRSSMPEWQLAETLGVSSEALSELLNVMASDRQVKLIPSEDGRTVVPL